MPAMFQDPGIPWKKKKKKEFQNVCFVSSVYSANPRAHTPGPADAEVTAALAAGLGLRTFTVSSQGQCCGTTCKAPVCSVSTPLI